MRNRQEGLNIKNMDKRIVVIYGIVIFVLILGLTYAAQSSSFAFNVDTALIGIDETKYGDTSFDASNLNFSPILDTDVEISTDKVIKIDFKVGAAQTNTASDVIYDVALNDLHVNCDLLSPYIKWKLVKNGTELSSGTFSYTFDTIDNGRLVLTNTQQDLPAYSASGDGYDEYSFYLWFSDSCQSTLSQCRANGNLVDQSGMLGKMLVGKIEVELYTGSKKTLVRKPGTTLDESTCGIMFLNEVEVGSYVAYTGNNGCPEGHCDGTNANYVSDTDMGYCHFDDKKFQETGWRIGYKKDNSAYLISAGAPECVRTYVDYRNTSTSTQTLSTNYYYGSGYTFDDATGTFTLTGVTSSTLAWSSNYTSIISNTPYTCKSISSTGTCSILYEVTAYSSSSQGITYSHCNYDGPGGENHIKHLDEVALTYCNQEYAYGGVCNSSSAWAMRGMDFQYITGREVSDCPNSSYDVTTSACGYGNTLIDNGSSYWYATVDASRSMYSYAWWRVGHWSVYSYYSLGVRPVLHLRSDIEIVGGTGTANDPYILG